MELLAIGLFVVFVAWVVRAFGAVSTFDRLAKGQVRARGLVLSASQIALPVTNGGRRFTQRTMTIDVEIEGRPNYVATGDFLIPLGLAEAIPGASLELAVDPDLPNQVTVLGPGGFTGPWLRPGPPAAF